MKAVALLCCLCLLLLTGCDKTQSFEILPGHTLYLTNNMNASDIGFSAEYPITITEGSCQLAGVAYGRFHCSMASTIAITDDRPSLLIWAHANNVKISYNPLSDFLR
jgi:hypothetical protein